MTAPKNEPIQSIRNNDRFTISYVRQDRIESAARFVVATVLIAFGNYFFYVGHPTIFSSNWYIIPICLFGNAGFFSLVFREGTIKSPLQINRDGAVRQSIWKWQFPGPMRAVSTKEAIELRYGTNKISCPRGENEGATISIVVRANQWIASNMHGQAGSTGPDGRKSETNWLLRACIVLAVSGFFCDVLLIVNGSYLDGRAPAGAWAVTTILLFSTLAIGALGIRLRQLFISEIKANFAVLLAEIAIPLLMLLGVTAVIGNAAQMFEMYETPGMSTVIDQPLNLTKTTHGKGCHRYLIIQEPSLGETVQYCDPQDIHYWDGVSSVRVRQSSNVFGLQIESVDRISSH